MNAPSAAYEDPSQQRVALETIEISVFEDRVRTIDRCHVHLEAGVSELRIPGMASMLDLSTLRIEAKEAEVLGIDYHLVHQGWTHDLHSENELRLEQLRAKIAGAQALLKLMDSLEPGETAHRLAPDALWQTTDYVLEARAECQQRLETYRIELSDIEHQLKIPQHSTTSGVLLLRLEKASSGLCEIHIDSEVGWGTWRPRFSIYVSDRVPTLVLDVDVWHPLVDRIANATLRCVHSVPSEPLAPYVRQPWKIGTDPAYDERSQALYDEQGPTQGRANDSSLWGHDSDTAARGRGNDTAARGRGSDTTARGRADALTARGRADALTARGHADALTARGRADALTARGRADALTARGRADVPTARGRADALTARGRADVPTARGRADALTARGRADVPIARVRADVPIARGRADVPTARGRADALTARGRADALTARGRADALTAQRHTYNITTRAGSQKTGGGSISSHNRPSDPFPHNYQAPSIPQAVAIEPHPFRVCLGEQPIAARLYYICRPVADRFAHARVEIEPQDTNTWPGGSVPLFMDGHYRETLRFAPARQGQPWVFDLGSDPAISAQRWVYTSRRSEGVLTRDDIHLVEIKIELESHIDKTAQIIVEDQIPITTDPRLRLKLAHTAPQANLDTSSGTLRFSEELPPHSRKTLLVHYEIDAPRDYRLIQTLGGEV